MKKQTYDEAFEAYRQARDAVREAKSEHSCAVSASHEAARAVRDTEARLRTRQKRLREAAEVLVPVLHSEVAGDLGALIPKNEVESADLNGPRVEVV